MNIELVRDLGMIYPKENSKRKVRYGIYLCTVCNSEFKAMTTSINTKHTKSCGCLKKRSKIKKDNISQENLTQELLKKEIIYDSATGLFTRKSGKKISQKTNNKGYLRLMIYGKSYLVHRLAWFYMYGYFPEEIDHKNQIKTDNRIENLREVSSAENSKNLPRATNNKSNTTGVYFDKRKNKWTAKIQVNYEAIFLGNFNTKSEAIVARKKANEKYKFYKNHGNSDQMAC